MTLWGSIWEQAGRPRVCWPNDTGVKKSCRWLSKKFYWSLIALQWLVSALWQSESATSIHISPFWDFLHRALSRVPCATQEILIRYECYPQYQYCIYVHPNLQIHLTPPSQLVFIHSTSSNCWVNDYLKKKSFSCLNIKTRFRLIHAVSQFTRISRISKLRRKESPWFKCTFPLY